MCNIFFQAAGSPSPELVFPPVIAPELTPLPFLARHMAARLEDYMRVVEQRRLAQMNRGANQETIERYTFPHKYKQVTFTYVNRIAVTLLHKLLDIFNVILSIHIYLIYNKIIMPLD